MFDIIAPLDAPQVFAPRLGGVEHPLAPAVVEAVCHHGDGPVSLWKVINGLAKASQPQGRGQRRCLCLRFWGAVRELLRFGVLYRHGPLIALKDFATRPRTKSPGRLSPPVGTSTCKMTGSIPAGAALQTVHGHQQPTERELVSADTNKSGCPQETESAPPTAAEISLAARVLAKKARKVKRPWTGYLDGERLKRGTLVQVPGGDVLPVYIALRGGVLVALPDEPRYADRAFARYGPNQVRRVKLPEAQLLGSLKRGIIEVTSEAKAATARANGRRAVHAGRRPRGRPPRSSFSLGSDGGGFTAPTGDGAPQSPSATVRPGQAAARVPVPAAAAQAGFPQANARATGRT